MTNKFNSILIHLDWIKRGYTFNDILLIQNGLKDSDPFSNAGALEIQKHLGGYIDPSEEITESDFEKIKYIVVESYDFNGNIDFLEKCINIEYLDICGVSGKGKIESLKPIENLKKLKYIDLHSHSISDISSLSGLENLEEIHLWGNPVKTIKPIVHLKNLKNVQLSEVEEDEVFELLKNSPGARVSYRSKGNDESFKAYWIKDWVFKTTHHKSHTYISTTIQPSLIHCFEEKLSNTDTDYISLMKQKSESFALSFLNENEEMVGSAEYQFEDVRFMQGMFEFRLK
jgi:hypothetical protein